MNKYNNSNRFSFLSHAITLAVLLLFCNTQLYAVPSKKDNNSQNKDSAPHLSQRQKFFAERYELTLETLLANKLISKEPQILDDRITVIYERLAELYCMPDVFKTLSYVGAPKTELCLKYLDKLTTAFTDSPAIPCIKFGLNHRTCNKAYQNQYVTVLKPEEFDNYEIPLETKVKAQSKETQDLIRKKKADIKALKEKYTSTFKRKKDLPEIVLLKRNIEKNYTELLNLSCLLISTRIIHEKPSDENKVSYVPTNQAVDQKLTDLFSQYNNSIKQKKSTPIPTPTKIINDSLKRAIYEPFQKNKKEELAPKNAEVKQVLQSWRVRYLTQTCLDTIHEAKQFSTYLPAASCYLEGDYSPACIAAWKKQKEVLNRDNARIKTNNLNKGFSTF